MAKPQTNITVVGGGLAGLTLALSLHGYGIQSTVYESRPRSYKAGGYIGLAPSALRVLHHLGVYDAIAADGYTYERMQIMNSRGFMIGTFFAGSKRAQGFPALRVRRSTLREVLLSEIDKRGVEIVYEKALKHLSEDGDVVKLVFADGAIITSGLVIGADGLRSTVRKAVAPDVQPYYNGFTAIYGLAEKEDLDQDTQNFPIPSMALGLNGSFAIIPVDPAGNRIGFVTGIVLPDRSTEEWKAFRKDNASLRDLMTKNFANENWPRAVQTLCHKTIHDEVLAWPVYVLPELTDWASESGRVIIIGDAAHAMSPASGQGGSIAFEDAETLAYALAHDRDASGGFSARLLSLWAAHRKQRVREVVAYATETEQRRRPSPNAVLQRIKEWAVWGMLWYHGEAGMSPWVSTYDGVEQMALLCNA